MRYAFSRLSSFKLQMPVTMNNAYVYVGRIVFQSLPATTLACASVWISIQNLQTIFKMFWKMKLSMPCNCIYCVGLSWKTLGLLENGISVSGEESLVISGWKNTPRHIFCTKECRSTLRSPWTSWCSPTSETRRSVCRCSPLSCQHRTYGSASYW